MYSIPVSADFSKFGSIHGCALKHLGQGTHGAKISANISNDICITSKRI